MGERVVGDHVRLVAALNYNTLANILQHAALFSIAFDGASHMSCDYIDVRLRFYWDGDVHDVHAMLIPIIGNHTGVNIYEHIKQLLDIICPSWRQKLTGISTDGAANMTGKIAGCVA